ncbi:MAG: hypothetical protein RI885_2440 [Actinomycetota bacterium]|jgi:hypothetical protein
MPVIAAVVTLALIVGALADLITRSDAQIKHLPKMLWVTIILFLPLIGSVLWFAIGREYARPATPITFGDPRRWEAPRADDRPARLSAASTLSTEDELAAIDAEIEHHENLARIRRLEAELEAKRRNPRES